jgi:hypothetical protein
MIKRSLSELFLFYENQVYMNILAVLDKQIVVQMKRYIPTYLPAIYVGMVST